MVPTFGLRNALAESIGFGSRVLPVRLADAGDPLWCSSSLKKERLLATTRSEAECGNAPQSRSAVLLHQEIAVAADRDRQPPDPLSASAAPTDTAGTAADTAPAFRADEVERMPERARSRRVPGQRNVSQGVTSTIATGILRPARRDSFTPSGILGQFEFGPPSAWLARVCAAFPTLPAP